MTKRLIKNNNNQQEVCGNLIASLSEKLQEEYDNNASTISSDYNDECLQNSKELIADLSKKWNEYISSTDVSEKVNALNRIIESYNYWKWQDIYSAINNAYGEQILPIVQTLQTECANQMQNDICQEFGGMERILTFDEAYDLANKMHEQGGDGFVETVTEETYKPLTVKQLLQACKNYSNSNSEI